jgi:hypothetical protein
MAELTEGLINQIAETHDTVMVLKTVLLGANGDKGLVGKVTDSCEKQEIMEDNQETLATRVTKMEVKSGFIALLISALVSIGSAVGSWFANKG